MKASWILYNTIVHNTWYEEKNEVQKKRWERCKINAIWCEQCVWSDGTSREISRRKKLLTSETFANKRDLQVLSWQISGIHLVNSDGMIIVCTTNANKVYRFNNSGNRICGDSLAAYRFCYGLSVVTLQSHTDQDLVHLHTMPYATKTCPFFFPFISEPRLSAVCCIMFRVFSGWQCSERSQWFFHKRIGDCLFLVGCNPIILNNVNDWSIQYFIC